MKDDDDKDDGCSKYKMCWGGACDNVAMTTRLRLDYVPHRRRHHPRRGIVPPKWRILANPIHAQPARRLACFATSHRPDPTYPEPPRLAVVAATSSSWHDWERQSCRAPCSCCCCSWYHCCPVPVVLRANCRRLKPSVLRVMTMTRMTTTKTLSRREQHLDRHVPRHGAVSNQGLNKKRHASEKHHS